MQADKLKVLIIILNYNSYQMTLNLVDSIHQQLKYPHYDIYVVDNASTNESARILMEQQQAKRYLLHCNEMNTGYAAGNNIGLRYGIAHGYKYLWILNNDVKLCDVNILTKLVRDLERQPKAACVGPKIVSLDGTVVAPYCRRPNLWRATMGIFFEKYYRRARQNQSQRVYRVYGCCMLLRSSAMDKIGCLDERTFLYYEELILAERLKRIDMYTYYDAETSIIHIGSVSVDTVTPLKNKFQENQQRKSSWIYYHDYRHWPLIAINFCNLIEKTTLWARKLKRYMKL